MSQEDKNINTLVIGKAKTGTTALSTLIKEETGAQSYILEPKGILDILRHPGYSEEKSNVTKIIFEHFDTRMRHLNAIIHNQLYVQYDKVVFIRRDIRDEMLSRLLYLSKAMAAKNFPKSTWEEWRDVLRKKEENPQSLSFREVCQAFGKIFQGNAWRDVVDVHSHSDRLFRDFIKTAVARKYGLINYEDMIDNKFDDLEEYMGFRFTKNTSDIALGDYQYTKRSAAYGGWKHFFLDSDVSLIRPILKAKQIDVYDDWVVEPTHKLEPKHFSEYVWKLSGYA